MTDRHAVRPEVATHPAVEDLEMQVEAVALLAVGKWEETAETMVALVLVVVVVVLVMLVVMVVVVVVMMPGRAGTRKP